MKKVFASDFDGTLYFYKAPDPEKLPAESVEKIKEYQAAGHLFGLCTGRQVGGLTPFITGLVEPDFFITSSGSNIVDRNFEEIQKRGIAPEVAQAILDLLQPKGFRMTLDVGGDICVFDEMDYPGKYYIIHSVEDIPEGLIHQVSAHTESLEEAAENVALVNEKFGDYVQAFQNVVEIDIAPKGCSKGRGVEALRDYYRNEFGDVCLFGIGDSLNDLPLIEAADVSYTFPYAPEEVQKKVTKVVENIVEALDDSMKR